MKYQLICALLLVSILSCQSTIDESPDPRTKLWEKLTEEFGEEEVNKAKEIIISLKALQGNNKGIDSLLLTLDNDNLQYFFSWHIAYLTTEPTVKTLINKLVYAHRNHLNSITAHVMNVAEIIETDSWIRHQPSYGRNTITERGNYLKYHVLPKGGYKLAWGNKVRHFITEDTLYSMPSGLFYLKLESDSMLVTQVSCGLPCWINYVLPLYAGAKETKVDYGLAFDTLNYRIATVPNQDAPDTTFLKILD